MKLDSTDALAVQGLKLLHRAELELANAMPDLTLAAFAPELKRLLERRLAISREHLNRLERVLAKTEQQPVGERCETMEGMLADIQLLLGEGSAAQVLDVALIAAMRQIGHFQIASYQTAIALAQTRSQEQAAQLLTQSLEEENDLDGELGEQSEKILGRVVDRSVMQNSRLEQLGNVRT